MTLPTFCTFWAPGASILALVCNTGLSLAAAPSAAGVEFFETKIRPLFVEHCYKCHSAQSEKVKGGLSLDTRQGLLKGGDSGSAIVPGDPDRSLLIKAVRYADEHLQMPPKDKKLSSDQIADLEAWVRMGAPDPRIGLPSTLNSQLSANQHWAFQPVRKPPVPGVKDSDWIQTPIDAFVLAKLEANGLAPSPLADKRTLIRRASYDLTGLPPTSQEVADFLSDESSDAFTRVVDRLLNSPRFGERWARHWLDVARYADTKGYVFEEERRFPYSYTYRDYVIRAFNDDLPFDQFVLQQIAADHLSLGEDKRTLAALGFLTLGRRFLNNQNDIIDDRIDVVTRGFMGLTVACARCHDHKYDPIPTADYYSLHGVFASSSEPTEQPRLGTTPNAKAYDDYLAERKKRQEELESFRIAKEKEALTQVRQRTGEYLLAAYDGRFLGNPSRGEGFARERKLHPATLQRWMSRLETWGKEHHPVFAPWVAFTGFPTNEFASKAREFTLGLAVGRQSVSSSPDDSETDVTPATKSPLTLTLSPSDGERVGRGAIGRSDSTLAVNPFVALAFAGEPPASMKDVAERYGKLFADVDKRWQETLLAFEKASGSSDAKSAPPAGFADPNLEALRQILYGADSPANVPSSEFRRLFDVPTAQRFRALQRKVDELDAMHPGAPPRAMALVDNTSPSNPRVFIRGNPNNPGSEVPRQFLAVLAGAKREPFKKGSGRLELAQAIASRDNPLTARVFVNRVWLSLFGVGLVRTPSDFGVRCDPPSHPELLDHLASRFMEEGWSVKKLIRSVVLSSVYQQGSDHNPRWAQIDPNNQWLWRMNRRRMDLEAMRDSLLTVAGKLDLTAGGRAVDITTEPFAARRTIYGFIERQNLPGMFRTFDFANPDTTSPQRFSTTVPQQALYMLNSPFVTQQARQFVARAEFKAQPDDAGRLKALYRLAYQRDPAPDEIEIAVKFLKDQRTVSQLISEPVVWAYGTGQYDDAAKRVSEFRPLPHFTGQAWQGGPKLPDPKWGWVMLTATGGHAGNDRQHAAIRRWTAPFDAVVTISGTLGHDTDKGDGVQGRIVSSRLGELGSWMAQKAKHETKLDRVEVYKGDTIDFVVDCRESVDSDGFIWAPAVRVQTTGSRAQAGAATDWDAKSDFSGSKEAPKPLSAWEKFAQVLLMSNELVFVD